MHASSHENRACQIPSKASLVLNLILLSLFIIVIRIWNLSTVQYAEKLEESRRPQRKVAIEPAKRGTIRDRFNLPLAINKVRYQAAVIYAPIKSIPTVKEYVDENGKKAYLHPRKEYIQSLAELFAKELGLDAKRIEDEIHSKAALFYNIPYVIKEEISEQQYYRLKFLEKDWLGVHVERRPKREYPRKKSAAEILGYMGAINKEEYELVIMEMKSLKEFLNRWQENADPSLPTGFESPYEVEKRYRDLEELAYTANDYVGKTGIESLFEQELRGFRGKKSFITDSRGNFIRDLPGIKEPLAGKRVLLSISAELQEYAEELLGQNERIRRAKISGHGVVATNEKQPWIKGGAIVAIEPETGDVLALASWPRSDPNDFILTGEPQTKKEKRANINRWFENEAYLADIWNMERPLERELFEKATKSFYEDKLWMKWEAYLDLILPENHPIITWFSNHSSLQDAIQVQRSFENKKVKSLIPEDFSPYNKFLLIDLCQLAACHEFFSDKLLEKVGKIDLSTYRDFGCTFLSLQKEVKEIAKTEFHHVVFKNWREENEKEYLKEKRLFEKLNKKYAKPYIDYLDEKEAHLFAEFWQKNRLELTLVALTGIRVQDEALKPFAEMFLAYAKKPLYASLKNVLIKLTKPQALEFLASFRSYQDLNRPLVGKYRFLRNGKEIPTEKHLAGAFYPTYGFGSGRSQAFRQAATQGSLFKIVTAYEALIQQYDKNKGGTKICNPLEMIDKVFRKGSKTYVGYAMDGTPIPQIYKGGRIPRSHLYNLGQMDIIKAMETSSNTYFSLLASDVLKSPEDLAKAARGFSFGSKTGIDLPGEIAGKVPSDLNENRTGLFALAIGQHSLVVTPLQTALMLSACVNGGKILKPQIVKVLAGHIPERNEELMQTHAFAFQEALALIGVDFPFFVPSSKDIRRSQVMKSAPLIKSQLDFPDSVRFTILEGLRKVVLKTQSESLWSLSKLYSKYPEAISDYIDLKHQLIGKTSTAESMERIDLDEKEGTNLYTHVWFGGIAFEKDVTPKFEKPELVVVVYLRYGIYGKEAAPLAAQIVKKWREIKQKRGM